MKNIILSAAVAAATLMSAGAAAANSAWVDHGIKLNARSGPGTQYHVIGTFNPCTKVHVVAQKWGWAKVAFNHNYYWVSAKYLQNHSCHYVPKKKVYKKKHYNSY